MPCRSDYLEGPTYGQEVKDELDKVTRLLCALCKAQEENKILQLQSTDLREWYEKHKWEDIRRGNS